MTTEPTAGWQNWRELLFMHWAVPEEALRRLVPSALELDAHEGKYYVGVVAFIMKDIRTAWMPKRFALNFLETNVRTYVRHKNEPGVFFFSLEASSPLAVRVARAQWGLPYFDAEMATTRHDERVRYRSTRRRSRTSAALDVDYSIGARLGDSVPGTLQHHLLERYWLFLQRRSVLWKGRVEHAPYPAQAATMHSFDESLVSAAGIARPDEAPILHFSPGVDVRVCPLRRA